MHDVVPTNRQVVQQVITELKSSFGKRLITSRAVCEQHGNTTTWIAAEPPDAVVFPQSTEDVQEAVRICARYHTPIIPFGTGTSFEGHRERAIRRSLHRLPGHEPRAGRTSRRFRLCG